MGWYCVSCVSELVLQTSRGCTTQNRPGPIHELSEGGMGGVAVHAKHVILSCGGKTGSPSGTTLVVQPLEVCSTNSETQERQYQPILFRSSNLFTSKWYVSGHGWLIKTLQPLEVCESNFETPCIFIVNEKALVVFSRQLGVCIAIFEIIQCSQCFKKVSNCIHDKKDGDNWFSPQPDWKKKDLEWLKIALVMFENV